MGDGRAFLERIYAAGSSEAARRVYDEGARDYDRILTGEVGYVSPRVCAEALAAHWPDRAAPIADLGCGTGLLGEALAALGYRAVEGFDFSPGMLALARGKGCYAALHEADLNARVDLPDGRYAAAVSAGAYGQHMGPDSLDEALRLVAPGGVFCFSVNERAFDAMGFRAKVEALAATGRVDIVSIVPGPYHAKAGIGGWTVVLRVSRSRPADAGPGGARSRQR